MYSLPYLYLSHIWYGKENGIRVTEFESQCTSQTAYIDA